VKPAGVVSRPHFADATWRRRGLAIVVAGTFCALAAPVPAHAEPKPSEKELKAKAKQLADQLEQLTEQYNGLRVRLGQAQRAARVAADNARRQEKSFEAVRQQIAKLAATSYMQGGADDPGVGLLAAKEPQALLDRASTLNFFATQTGTNARNLMQTLQASQRARKSAEERARQVERLRSSADRKRRDVESLYNKIRSKLGQASPKSAGNAPSIPGSGKGAQAVRYALAQLGVPYSWGGGGPSGPTFGTKQGAGIKGFDCSGLTLYAYARVGINLPHYTGDQFKAGVHVSQSQLQPGDLVFFYTDLHHMGMYIGGGKMVHAPQTGDVVKISPIAGRPWAGGVRVA
jgi:cell wall-associated NlpC family hydrolase